METRDNDTIVIPVAFLRRLLDEQEQYYLICDQFKIPLTMRKDSWVGKGIIERIHTYLTSYLIKRSMAEKETGAAFTEVTNPLLQDPEFKEN